MAATLSTLPAMAANSGTTTNIEGSAVKTAVKTEGKTCARGCNKLSDEQLTKLVALKTDFLKKTAPEKVELFTLTRELKTDFAKPISNKAELLSVQDKINSVRATLADDRLSYRVDAFSVLSPEQQEQIKHKILVKEAFGGRRGLRHGSHMAMKKDFRGNSEKRA
jgi:Spy/CpxP family protein refolding chaperone